MNTNPISPAHHEKLVDMHGLLDSLFEPTNRPSIRWVQYQMKRRTLPFFRIGRLVRFDPTLVRQALEQHCLVAPRAGLRRVRAQIAAASSSGAGVGLDPR